jgi:hypothetical protein
MPDLIVEQDYGNLLDVEEIDRLEGLGVHRDYVTRHLEGNEELFDHLARFGESRGAAYPDFDAFYDSLDTEASRESVKFMLRRKIIEVMQDKQGAEFIPVSPLDQDEQLQAAVIHLHRQTGHDLTSMPDLLEYDKRYDRLLARQDELRRRYTSRVTHRLEEPEDDDE